MRGTETPMKQAGIALIVLSIFGATGYGFYVQFFSGSRLGAWSLNADRRPTRLSVELAPEMAPLRLLIELHYRRSAFGRARIDYRVRLNSPDGRELWTANGDVGNSSALRIGTKSSRRRTHRSPYGSQTESVRLFDVPEKGTYTLECSLNERAGTFRSGHLKLRANAERVEPWTVALCAGPGTVLGILLLALSSRGKTLERTDTAAEIEVGPEDAV